MNYESKKAEIESKIKELQNELENLKKQENKEAWKNSLVEKFKEFLENMDPETAAVEIRALRDDNAFILNLECYEFCNFKPENTAKVETEPTAEPKAEEKTEPTTEPEKPENKVVVCSVPKPNETPEEKPVKMKMSLDEFIDSLPEPAEK